MATNRGWTRANRVSRLRTVFRTFGYTDWQNEGIRKRNLVGGDRRDAATGEARPGGCANSQARRPRYYENYQTNPKSKFRSGTGKEIYEKRVPFWRGKRTQIEPKFAERRPRFDPGGLRNLDAYHSWPQTRGSAEMRPISRRRRGSSGNAGTVPRRRRC